MGMAKQEGPGIPSPSMGQEAIRLPMTGVRNDYRFVGPEGEVDLLGLFAGRRQLIVYRFFYAPDVENWPDGSCSGCAFFANTVTYPAHLAARDTTLVFVSAAPQERIAALGARMGWGDLAFFTLVGDDFSRDFGVKRCSGSTSSFATAIASRHWDDRKTGRPCRKGGRRAPHTNGGGFTTTTAMRCCAADDIAACRGYASGHLRRVIGSSRFSESARSSRAFGGPRDRGEPQRHLRVGIAHRWLP